jgi:uncharacterized protein (TIGR02569 family)
VPSGAVLTAFGCRADPVSLPGGEGRSWRSGTVVLKPADDPRQVCWTSEVFGAIAPAGVVIPRPIRAHDGAWVVDGWFATEFIDGAHHQPRRWGDIITAGQAFHAALADVARPDWMNDADDWWRRADQVAWDAREPTGDRRLVELVERLRVLRGPVSQRDQVVHGDLCGNVLFDAQQQPVIIDFSAYWRPADWASAVVAVDAFEWEGAGVEALHWLDTVANGYQLVLRAAIYRIATSAEVAAVHGLEDRKLSVHRATVEALEL